MNAKLTDDVSKWTIAQLIGRLRPSQLYFLLGIVAPVVSSAFAAGYFVKDLEGATPNDISNKIIVEADNYGVNQLEQRFQAVMRWEEPSERTYVFEKGIIQTHSAWAYVRLRTDSTNIREAIIPKLIGPIPLKNGIALEIPLTSDLMESYADGVSWLQLIVFALPNGVRPEEGKQIKDYGDAAKVLITSSVRRRA